MLSCTHNKLSSRARYFLKIANLKLRMLGIRKFLGCLVRLWSYAIQTICRRKQQHGLDSREQRAAPDGAAAADDQWNVEGWEDFSVKVVPNSGDSDLPPEGNTLGEGEAEAVGPNGLQQDNDFFEDMKPVFHKPMKVRRGNGMNVRCPCNHVIIGILFHTLSLSVDPLTEH